MTSNAQHHDLGKTWAVPLITGHRYEIWWGDTGIDWTRLMMRIWNYDDADWLQLAFPFAETREHFTVTRGTAPDCDAETETCPRETEPNLCDLKDYDTFVDDSSYENSAADVGYYGDHAFNNATDVRMFELIVNGKTQDAVRDGTVITVNAHKCWYDCE